MTRVLAIHLNKNLVKPIDNNSFLPAFRYIEYGKKLDHYSIITKTYASSPYPVYRPLDNMQVIGTDSKNRYFFLYDAYRLACKVIGEKKIDVITTQDQCWLGLLGLWLRRKYEIPLNIQVHWEFVNNPYFRQECLEHYLWDKIGRYVLPRADTWYVGTSKQKQDMIKYGLPKERIFHIPFTIMTDKFEVGHPCQIRKELADKGFRNVLLWVGRMVKQKDLGTLIQAAAEVIQSEPETALILLGQGPEKKLVDGLISKLRIKNNVIMPGFLSQQECINYYHAADVICVTSLYEGTCRVFLEAMAAAKPIITTDVAGAFDAVIDGKNGYIIKKKDSKKFGQVILEVLSNKEKAASMGQEGKKLHLRDFTMQYHYDGFINMWNQTKILGIK